MKLMAIDYGDARTGVACSDLTGSIVGETAVITAYTMERTLERVSALAAEKRLSAAQLEKCVAQRLEAPAAKSPSPAPLLRDNRIVINALMNTVRELTRIGVPVKSRVEEQGDHIDVIVTIPNPAGATDP